jgi:UPF0716 family protein affecting phage T7 exclusion
MATMIAVMVISFLMLFCKICLLIAIEKEIGAPITIRLSSLSTTTECYFLDSNLSVNNILSAIDRYMISPTLMASVLSSE